MSEHALSFFPKQLEFLKAIFSGRYWYLLYGGAIRGGKSYVGIGAILMLAKMYPGSRWAIVRKDLPRLKRNTLPVFEKMAPRPFVGEMNRSDWLVKCANESTILLFPESIKDDPDLDRWKGLEVNGFLLEEQNEMSEAGWNKSIERAGTWKCPGEQPPPLVFGTCNPSRNYVKRVFYDPWSRNNLKAPFFFLPASVVDNPALDPNYLKSLENLKTTDPRAYERFVLGNWEVADEPDQLVMYEWLQNARNVEAVPGKKRLGVDVARYGDDDTVIVHRDGNRLSRIEYHHGLAIDRTADLVMVRMNEGPVDANQVMVDVVGLGAGVVDNCRRNGFDVVEVQSGGKMVERDIKDGGSILDGVKTSVFSFNNLRSQLWWEFREEIRTGNVCIDVEDHRLIEDLTAPRYSISGDKVLKVESKDEIRRRIGRSTDAGDAAVYAWAEIEAAPDYLSMKL